jgi:hypothetical protein
MSLHIAAFRTRVPTGTWRIILIVMTMEVLAACRGALCRSSCGLQAKPPSSRTADQRCGLQAKAIAADMWRSIAAKRVGCSAAGSSQLADTSTSSVRLLLVHSSSVNINSRKVTYSYTYPTFRYNGRSQGCRSLEESEGRYKGDRQTVTRQVDETCNSPVGQTCNSPGRPDGATHRPGRCTRRVG